MENEVLEQYIILKKYIKEEDYIKINELQDVCIKEDKINLKLELEYRMQVPKSYEKDLNDINEFLYYINNELVGYIGISNFGGNAAEINGMVHPLWRRNGVFTKLCNMAIEEAKRRNFNDILLLCDEKSSKAIEFINTIGGNYSFSECRMKRTCRNTNENNKDISLRKAINEDVKEIKKLNTVLFGDDRKEEIALKDEEIVLKNEEENNIITYLIELDKKVIGKIKVEREKNKAFICGFGIYPEFRNKGYGRQALTETLNIINKEYIFDIELDVEIKNKKALKLYKYCSFEEQSLMNYYEIIK